MTYVPFNLCFPPERKLNGISATLPIQKMTHKMKLYSRVHRQLKRIFNLWILLLRSSCHSLP